MNPLEPIYQHRDEMGSGEFLMGQVGEVNASYGAIKGSKPASLPHPVEGVRNLQTTDIKGAGAGSKALGAFSEFTRRQVREVMATADILGT